MRSTRRLLVALAVATLPAALEAQIVVSTGANVVANVDQRWQISTNGGASYFNAFVVQSPPGQWGSGAPGGVWLGANLSGTLGAPTNYRLRTQFTLNPGDLLTFSFRCAMDNSGMTWFLNGASLGSACGPDNTFTWGAVTPTTGWVAGSNTLEFRWSGDGTTDGAAVEISALNYRPAPVSTVPEPSTYALLATGLAGLGLAARRRRA